MAEIKEKELVCLKFLHRENNYRHHHYDEEMKQYELLKAGDFEAIKESEKMFSSSLVGKLSSDPVRHFRYLFVASATLATRFAIEGGMEAETAYNISDLYINRMDICKTSDEIAQLNKDMFYSFTRRMSMLKRKFTVHKTITICMDYIELHLHETITVSALANYVGFNASYLSTLFHQETGLTISEYVRKQKIEVAKNMLKFSELSLADIASYLAFTSQSYFIRVFKRETGYTPNEYKRCFFRHNLLDTEE